MSSTKVFYLPGDEAEALASAMGQLSAGGIVVIPTETIYGLTCNALNGPAVAKLFGIKGRALDKPSAVFVHNHTALGLIAEISSGYAQRIVERMLPGPLTVVLRSRLPETPGIVGTDGKIGVRVSRDPFVAQLTAGVEFPLIATSANLSGGPDCRTPEELLSQFANRVPVIILRPRNPVTLGSTVVDLTGRRPRLLREGTIPFAEVLKLAESD